MPWPLKHITVVAQCPICRGQFPDVDAFGYDACPSGCRDPQTFTATLRPVDQATGDPPQVGDCFYRPDFLKAWPGELVPKYFQLNSHRPPITVVLPPYGGDGTGNWWLVDAYASSDKRDGTGPDG